MKNQNHKLKTPLTYKDSGVDINAGNALIERIKPISKSTHRPEIIGSLGGFNSLCHIPKKYNEPILVSSTDGVGTKLKLAIDLQRHDGIGIDLVAMCVNDLIVNGAEPLFFLDYFSTGKLDIDTAEKVIAGIGRGCNQAGCALIGGETAEMPGLYQKNDYDLAGFCVGVLEKSKIIDGSTVSENDTLIALGSSGIHSNGFSLIRKILHDNAIDLNQKLGSDSLADLLLEPTRIYVKSLLSLCEELTIKTMAHITGGGITENLPRSLPSNCQAVINTSSWEIPELFNFLQTKGNIDHSDMLRTFNCGVGMIICVSNELANTTVTRLNQLGENAFIIGHIEKKQMQTASVIYR